MTIAFRKAGQQRGIESKGRRRVDRVEPVFLVDGLSSDDGPSAVALFEEVVEAAGADDVGQTPSTSARWLIVILTCEMAREATTSQVKPPRKCRMLTPLLKPSRLTSMNRVAGPWNQVAVIHPSECQTVEKRSQSAASRQRTQFSTVSRMARRSIAVGSMEPLGI